MICISVTPESRVLAKADLLNAARQCDIVELCLDRLIKPPDVGELIRDVGKPVVVSCRRVRDGGHWDGGERERLAMLRSAIDADADYVELEYDVASQVSRRGRTQRVISFTNLEQPLEDVRNVFDLAASVDADVVKFTWPTPTLDAVWPMLAAASRRREVPVVGMGLGVSSRSFSLLGRKYNCPWIYAALERGMESHDGQVTVSELDDVFGWRDIGPRTQFVGIVGFGGSRERATRVLNAAFRQLKLDIRCLPLDIGSMQKLPQMLELLQIDAILTTRDMGRYVMPLARKRDELAEQGGNADLLLRRSDSWTAYNVVGRAVVWVVKQSLKRQAEDRRPLVERSIVVVGHDRIASSVLHALKKVGATTFVTSSHEDPDADEILFCAECGAGNEVVSTGAKRLAEQLEFPHLPFHELADTAFDVLIVTEHSLQLGFGPNELNPTQFRAPLLVVDLRQFPNETDLTVEARLRGCTVVKPGYVFAEQLAAQFKAVTNEELPVDAFVEAIDFS